ncbi:hypothetical protein HPB49_004453 [Dermacentor silvarum]|uniref:Uncharacterized protein n=1 Tax=Dermacentor silvarum TaxID=543639 RepID=A0ACB8D3B4_DERSI|nr:hypothetical protein HPB49_004453 [Dermacentor silvarum]
MASSFPAQAPGAKDLAAKVQILKALQAGASRKEVMEKFQVKKSTLSEKHVKNEDESMQAYDGDMFGNKRKRLRTAAHPKLEEALLRWIAVSRAAQFSSSSSTCLFHHEIHKAEKFALSMNIDSFNASEGWFDRFKKRHRLVFRNVCGEKGAVSESVVHDWRS